MSIRGYIEMLKRKEREELKKYLECDKFTSMKTCYYGCHLYPECRLIYVEWRNKNARK